MTKRTSKNSTVIAPEPIEAEQDEVSDYRAHCEQRDEQIRKAIEAVPEPSPEAAEVTAFIRTNPDRLKGKKVVWETVNWKAQLEIREGYLAQWSDAYVSYHEGENDELMSFIPSTHVLSARMA